MSSLPFRRSVKTTRFPEIAGSNWVVGFVVSCRVTPVNDSWASIAGAPRRAAHTTNTRVFALCIHPSDPRDHCLYALALKATEQASDPFVALTRLCDLKSALRQTS